MCVFLAGYIPFRLIVLAPPCVEPSFGLWTYAKGLLSWSIPRSLMTLWGSGAAVVFYSQVLFTGRDQDSFFSPFFWWIFGLYPFISVLVGICFALIYARLSVLDFRRSLALETAALLPLYLFIPFSILPYSNNSVDTTSVAVAAALIIVAVKLFLLRSYLPAMLKTLFNGMAECRRHIWPIIPVICAIVYIVVWIPSTKVNTLSSTIAASGRTLHDVSLYSAHLSDAFVSTSNVYIGVVTAGFLVFFFVALFRHLLTDGKSLKSGRDSDLMIVFFGFIAFCCYILSFGLAFGKSSLYLLLYYYLPFFNYPRVSDRIIVMALFAMAIIVGYIVQRLQQRSSRPIFAGICLLALGLAVLQLKDFNVFKPLGVTVLDKGQDIYSHVKNNREDGLLLEIPLWPGDSHQSSLYQHYAMLDRVPRVNGYSPLVRTDYIEKIFKQLGTLNQGELDRRQYELLRELNVEFITVHNNKDIFLPKVSPFGALTTIRRLYNSPYLEYVDIDNFMHFKDFDKKNENLILFRMKDIEPDDLEDDEPAWYEVPVFYGVRSRLLHQVGEIVMDEDIQLNVFMATEGTHPPGYLVYGPYTHHAAGDYRCYFTMRAEALKESEDIGKDGGSITRPKLARIEVSRFKKNGEQLILAQKELRADQMTGAYQREYLDFSLAEYSKLEFRVFYYGQGEVRVEQVAVYERNHDIPLNLLEAEKMVGSTGRPVYDRQAHNKKAVEAVAGKSKEGELVYGPNRVYPAGRYSTKYYLRLQDGDSADPSATAAVLSVTDEHNERVYGRRKVGVAELSEEKYQAVGLDFETFKNQELSFTVQFTGTAGVLLDKIEIERD
jgi:hypothetical protein